MVPAGICVAAALSSRPRACLRARARLREVRDRGRRCFAVPAAASAGLWRVGDRSLNEDLVGIEQGFARRVVRDFADFIAEICVFRDGHALVAHDMEADAVAGFDGQRRLRGRPS